MICWCPSNQVDAASGAAVTTNVLIPLSNVVNGSAECAEAATLNAVGISVAETAKPVPLDMGATGGSTSPIASLSPAVEDFSLAMAEANKPVVAAAKNLGNSANGEQASSLKDAQELARLGGNQAATVGAIFCAQGASANLTNTADAAAYYAKCQQNYSAANLLNPHGGYAVDEGTLSGAAAKQSLEEFDKNFGVAPLDYMKRMLGAGGGPSALSDLVGDKLSSEKLAAALKAANNISPNEVTSDPSRFAMDLGKGKKDASTSSLRESLKKRMAARDASPERSPASGDADTRPATPEKYEELTPASDGLFAAQDDASLTLFDVVHLRYAEIRKRWRR